MLATATRRLPGIRFEPEPPPPTPLLPRMDIAVFVGFAARGPLDTPVPVEDMARFTDVFGEELPLAWDAERGTTVTAQLRPAVQAFFRNGGRRCWIVRVAGRNAASVEFPVPGLLRCRPGRTDRRFWDAEIAPAKVRASSKGPWALRDTVAVSISVQDIAIDGLATIDSVGDASDGHARFEIPLLADSEEILAGDVLRLRLVQDRVVFVAIDTVEPGGKGRIVARGERSAWFREIPPPENANAVVAYIDDRGRARAAHATVPRLLAPGETDPAAAGAGDQDEPGDRSASTNVALDIEAVGGEWPAPGSWVRISIGRRRWWLVVETAATVLPEGDATERVRVTGPVVLRTWPNEGAFRRTFARTQRATVERLRLGLWAGVDGKLDQTRGDLGLAARHPRFLGDLPTDERVFGNEPWRPWESAVDRAEMAEQRGRVAGEPGAAFYIPFALGTVPRWAAGPIDRGRPALELSDLGELRADIFIDRALANAGAARLASEADFIRYESPVPRALTGIHAAFGIEEASLIAVPDATQPRWTREHVTAPQAAPVLPEPSQSQPETFDDCEIGPLEAPVLGVARDAGTVRAYTLRWSQVEHATAYELEEVREPETWRPPVLRSVDATSRHISRSVPGTYRYRVRALAPGLASPWSAPISVTIEGQALYRVDDRADASLALEVHAALLRMCAARGDMFALLAIPEGADGTAAIEHVARLRGAITGLSPEQLRGRLSGDVDPMAVLSYGALFHPWVLEAADAAAAPSRATPGAPGSRAVPTAPARPRPPDGGMTGVFAQRAAARGAWVAPANVALRDVLGLVRPIPDEDQGRLFDAQIDVVRRTPAGFLTLAADSLSLDRALRPLNVRRLLALLRRLAILHGTDYVFEPNSDAFRRRIQRGFEALLALLFERGAFAGTRADDAFRVAIADPPNSVQSLDAGRLIVELKVAPSLPLEFLTVRLVRSGDRFAVELP